MKPPLVVGNWKMHGTQAEALALLRQMRKELRAVKGVEVVLAPPFTAISAIRRVIRGSSLQLAGQNAHWEAAGAFTGEISPLMLRELDCRFVIIGHSERRRLFNESDQTVAKKMTMALRSGLRPILCVGETLRERRIGITARVIARQMRVALKGCGKNVIGKIEVAYEPVWAIGTGHNATPEQVSDIHRRIRAQLEDLFGANQAERCRILYGGSVRPDNAEELARIPEVNGLLVGGASLKARDFLSIARCFVRRRK